jgi:seryl-tRNA synthetase
MLDIKFIRENPDLVRESLRKKGEDAAPLDEILRLDRTRRNLLQEAEALRARHRQISKEIGKEGKTSSLIPEMKTIDDIRENLEKQIKANDRELNDLLLNLPNIVHESVPDGKDESENVVVRHWGEPQKFPFTPLPHWELGERLGIIDFARGVKLSGSRFYVLKGLGAKLERALIDWMIDLHTREHGYVEVATPYLVRREVMVGTGQLPKFKDDLYHCDVDDLFLIPTAEVPMVNLHRDEIFDPGVLPLYYVGYTACFRREAGAAGRDTRGVIRVHQFDKVELVKFTEPATSYDELEKLLDNAADVLRKLNIPYRITLMCSGDLGFAATKKYDIDAWLPGQNRYVEVSSCSNCESFQARRASIRYRPAAKAKPFLEKGKTEFVHTLNGSGLAVGRTLAAVLENYQQPDGSVIVPEVLRPYLGRIEVIR